MYLEILAILQTENEYNENRDEKKREEIKSQFF